MTPHPRHHQLHAAAALDGRRRGDRRAPSGGDARGPRTHRRLLPVRAGARGLPPPRRRRRRRRRRPADARPGRARPGHGAALVRARRPRAALRPHPRRHAHVPLDRGRGRARPRPRDRRGALLAQGRRRAHGARRRRPAGDLVLLAAGERPGPRPHGAAARVPRRADQHAQARARRHDAAPAPGRARRRDGDRGRRLRGGAAGAAADLRQHLHDQPPVAGRHRPRGGARLRRGRHPRELHGHADHGLDGAGFAGRGDRPGRGRGRERHGARPAGRPGRAGLPQQPHLGDGPAQRRLHRRHRGAGRTPRSRGSVTPGECRTSAVPR